MSESDDSLGVWFASRLLVDWRRWVSRVMKLCYLLGRSLLVNGVLQYLHLVNSFRLLFLQHLLRRINFRRAEYNSIEFLNGWALFSFESVWIVLCTFQRTKMITLWCFVKTEFIRNSDLNLLNWILIYYFSIRKYGLQTSQNAETGACVTFSDRYQPYTGGRTYFVCAGLVPIGQHNDNLQWIYRIWE